MRTHVGAIWSKPGQFWPKLARKDPSSHSSRARSATGPTPPMRRRCAPETPALLERPEITTNAVFKTVAEGCQKSPLVDDPSPDSAVHDHFHRRLDSGSGTKPPSAGRRGPSEPRTNLRSPISNLVGILPALPITTKSAEAVDLTRGLNKAGFHPRGTGRHVTDTYSTCVVVSTSQVSRPRVLSHYSVDR